MFNLLSTHIGMYVVQTVFHSLTAVAVANISYIAWNIEDPAVKQRLRIMAIVLPAVSYPAYQALNPERGSVYFRLDALFDVNRWMALDVLPGLSFIFVFAAVLVVTAVIFIIQELLPIVSHFVEIFRGDEEMEESEDEAVLSKVRDCIEGLDIEEDSVTVIEDEEPLLFSSIGRTPHVFVSSALVQELSPGQLQTAIAHEAAHIVRSRKPVLVIVYIIRSIMFYNPVAMLQFRKATHEEEEVCDDMAVAATGKPGELAEVIDILSPSTEDFEAEDEHRGVKRVAEGISIYSHNALLRERIRRIKDGGPASTRRSYALYVVTLIAIAVMNYYIV